MLFGSAILEVAIGLVFVYLLLSLICSAVNEWIAGLLGLRPQFLRKGVENLLADPVLKGLADQFFAHPLIKGLSQNGKQGPPSYIPAHTFARVLIDLLPTPPVADPLQPRSLLDIYHTARTTLAGLAGSDSELAKTLLRLLDEAGIDPQQIAHANDTLQALTAARKKLLDALQATGNRTQNNEIVQGLFNTVTELETYAKQTDAELTAALLQAQTNVETYFEDAMARVSGWYKRQVQFFIVLIALGVSLLLNADSIAIANNLVVNGSLRAAVVAVAEKDATDLGGMVAQTHSSTNNQALNDTLPITATASVSTTAINPLTTLQGLGLPLGWGADQIPKSNDWSGWLSKLLGLLITAAAISLGAPFWFEVLNKFVNLRLAGPKPQTAPVTGPPIATSTKK